VIRALLCIALGALACTPRPTVTVSPGVTIYERVWNDAVDALGTRASFDFGCPAEELEFTVLHLSGRYITQMGVSGCGQRGVYVRRGTGDWVINSTDEPRPGR